MSARGKFAVLTSDGYSQQKLSSRSRSCALGLLYSRPILDEALISSVIKIFREIKTFPALLEAEISQWVIQCIKLYRDHRLVLSIIIKVLRWNVWIPLDKVKLVRQQWHRSDYDLTAVFPTACRRYLDTDSSERKVPVTPHYR